MSDWYHDLFNHHRLDYADDPDSLTLGHPATPEAIEAFEKSVGHTMPEEFHDLYQQFNGYGTAGEDDVDWFFLPLDLLPEHVAGIREWFRDTHPDIASRFVPFVDWGNGDASGYLFSESGEVEPGIYMFEHESCDFEKEQDWREFLFPVDENLRSFIND